MRQIVFRGKTIDTNKWVYGNLWRSEEKAFIGEIGSYTQYEVSIESVGQSTGLKDKTGEWIYEGDIVMTYVLFTDEEEIQMQFYRVGEIRFIRGCFYLTNCTNYQSSCMESKCEIQPSPKSNYDYPAYRSEVIGNIHDNPTLLTSKT